jgi:tellurite resistance protein
VSAKAQAAPRPTLAHLPLPLLAMPMGLGGVGLAWRQAHGALGAPAAIGEALLLLTALVWVGVVALQAARLLRHPDAVIEEVGHPVRVAFAAAPTIGLMILAAAAFPHAPRFGAALWSVAVAVHLLVAMLLLRRVLGGRGDPAMIAPPLLIPLVGNILAPVFGVGMGFHQLSWMMFGIGLVLWLAVQPLLLYRLFAGPALPPPLVPSLVILVAPPAVGALAVGALTGSPGGPALALAGVALLLAAVLLAMAGDFARIPFGMAWWGTTFPSAAFAIMLITLRFPPWLTWPALVFATLLTGWVTWRTALAARAGTFYRPE